MTTPTHTASGRTKSVAVALTISAAMVAPFAFLEWFNRRALHEEFPLVLFTFMSVHALLIVFLVAPAARRFRAGGGLGTLRIGHWVGLALSAVLMVAYARVVIDQLPCFLGVANCD